MLIKTNKKNRKGRDIYRDDKTGKNVVLPQGTGRAMSKLPDYVFGTFLKPFNPKY